MKTVKLSLIAALTAGLCTGASASDTLADAFKDGKVSGQIQAYYWDRDKGPNADADIMNFGLDLSYETARFHGFGFKATMQSSSSPFIDDEAKQAFASDMHGSGASLSEAYLSYAYDKTTVQAGRMYISTPIIASSGSRMNKEAFEGALLTNSNIPDTTLTFAYVTKMQNRTDGNGDFGKFTKQFSWQGEVTDGAYTFALKNTSIPNTKLTLAYLDAKDLMKITYSEIAFNKDIFGLAAQYYYADKELAGAYDKGHTDLFGLKGTVQLGKLGLAAAYTTTGDKDVNYGLGNGADLAYAWSNILGNNYTADTDSYRVGANYQVTEQFKVGANYVIEDKPTRDVSILGLSANYKFTGALKGLNATVMYDKEGKDGFSDATGKRDELRVNLVYSF